MREERGDRVTEGRERRISSMKPRRLKRYLMSEVVKSTEEMWEKVDEKGMNIYEHVRKSTSIMMLRKPSGALLDWLHFWARRRF